MNQLNEIITTEQILDLLPIVADQEWKIEGCVIRNTEGVCPICAVVNEIIGEKNWRLMAVTALNDIGVEGGVGGSANQFILAADGEEGPIRDQIIDILGVS